MKRLYLLSLLIVFSSGAFGTGGVYVDWFSYFEAEVKRFTGSDLFQAAKEGNIEQVQFYAKRNPEDINKKEAAFNNHYTPLMIAIENRHVKVVRFLLQEGAEVNPKMSKKKANPRAAGLALGSGNDEAALTLLVEETPPLILAVENGMNVKEPELELIKIKRNDRDIEIVKMLLSAGADVNAETVDGWTALMWARKRNNRAIIDLLKQAGARKMTCKQFFKLHLAPP